jgi:outer membrane lipoprotein SlyB
MSRGLFRLTALAVVVVFGAGLITSCAEVTGQVEKHPRTATGAVVGGAGGAVVGGLLGGTKGAIIGGLLGALGGGAIGNYTEKQQSTREQTLRETGAQPGQNALNIQSVTARPESVAPGGQVDISMTYALVTAQPQKTTSVRESREITFNKEVVGQMTVDRQRTSGTWESSVPVTLPQSAQPGTYTITASVSGEGLSDAQQTTFTVR